MNIHNIEAHNKILKKYFVSYIVSYKILSRRKKGHLLDYVVIKFLVMATLYQKY